MDILIYLRFDFRGSIKASKPMKITHLIIITVAFLCASCNAQPSHSTETNSAEDIRLNCGKDTTLLGRISEILSKKFRTQINKLKIDTVQLSECSLFWSDPGYVRGPEIAIEDSCYAVSFTTHSFDGFGGNYSDDYVFYFPFHKKFGILYNCYYGKNYHGGSSRVVPDPTDRSFDSLQFVLVHTKDKMWYQIEQEIQKK